jgi:hypothetical protein
MLSEAVLLQTGGYGIWLSVTSSPVLSCVNIHSQQHVLVMCATAFYLIENYPLDVGPEFSASVIQVSRPWPFLVPVGQH